MFDLILEIFHDWLSRKKKMNCIRLKIIFYHDLPSITENFGLENILLYTYMGLIIGICKAYKNKFNPVPHNYFLINLWKVTVDLRYSK